MIKIHENPFQTFNQRYELVVLSTDLLVQSLIVVQDLLYTQNTCSLSISSLVTKSLQNLTLRITFLLQTRLFFSDVILRRGL